ncbi:MAG: glycosyltransferase family 4 protein [Carboxylicivirga sp.]|jgi:glycosyltransferase involved in cell wall biosynthesis|nr:glycosyltransferase family 4 protein [Carboxylicivirga sp.]
MKILFCAYDRPGHIATGPNAWIQRLIPDLLNKKLDIITHFFYEGKEKECPTIQYFKNNRLPYLSYSLEKLPYTEVQVGELLKAVRKYKITVLVANLVIPAFYTAKYLQQFNIPVIPVLHSNEPHTRGVIEKFVNKKNTGINHSVSVSKLINSYILDINKNGIHQVIPCGTPQVRYQTQLCNDKLKVIYAGRIEVEQKQIFLLTEAFIKCSKALPKIEFNIYGNGRCEKEVESIIEGSLGHYVEFKGAVPPSEIQKVMAKHQVFTLMSDYEGMPIALMEAMACGLVPVCLSEESGINEIIVNGVNGFIVNNRDKDYQDKLEILQKNPELWQQMSHNAIRTIEEKYSTKVTHKQWFDLLNSFNTPEAGEIKIPKQIILEGEPLLYGDNRKPGIKQQIIDITARYWLSLRLAIRPRARIKAMLNK